jgi:aminoglycoside phosphotransferase family enzyme/predicted kinase
MNAGLLRTLQDPALYDHPVSGFEVIETHISWVLLTGSYAYKIKKALDLGFVDCTDLRQRRHYCHEEIRLNRRLAPALYLDVRVVLDRPCGVCLNPDIDANADAPEYAREYLVRMRQFDQHDLLDHLQESGALTVDHIDSLGEQVADFHQHTERAGADTGFGHREEIARWSLQNFDQAGALATSEETRKSLDVLRRWTESALIRLTERLDERKAGGYIRDCHGDLHLGNVAVVDDAVTVFDCIEFNDELRIIDVISEIAFMFMDLRSRDETALAWRLLDRYLAGSGDYEGLDLLRFYAVYRAMVRTKVAMIRGSQPKLSDEEAQHARCDANAHLVLATRLMNERRPMLILTRGLSGSGKSRLAGRLVESCGLIRLRSDVERKRLHGLAAMEHSDSALGAGIYSRDAGRLTYQGLADKAARLLSAGLAVIVDATFLETWQRELFTTLSRNRDIPLHILDLHADEVTLRRRISRRLEKGGDPSEADLSVLERQIATADPLTPDELAVTRVIDANDGQVDRAMETLPDLLGCRVC